MKAVLALGALLAAAAVGADDGRAQLEQRIGLTSRLIADSPTSQRIVASGHLQAMNHLEEGRLRQSMAEDALRRGDLASARREVDDALHHISMARRLVPDAPTRQAAARQRHEQLLANLERMIEAWQARIGPGGADDGDLVAALGLVQTARHFSEASRYEDSVHTLRAAEGHVLTGMNRMLQSREIDYTQRASGPAEEFQIELQRHASLSELLPLALSELRPRAEAAALIERYGEASRALRGQATQKFRDGDPNAALADLRSATVYVQRALGAAGVSTPQPSGSLP